MPPTHTDEGLKAAHDPQVVATLVARRRPTGLLDDLTQREREILALMAEGRSNAGICERLVLSTRTVETHVRTILHKLGLPSAADDHRRVLAVLAFLRLNAQQRRPRFPATHGHGVGAAAVVARAQARGTQLTAVRMALKVAVTLSLCSSTPSAGSPSTLIHM